MTTRFISFGLLGLLCLPFSTNSFALTKKTKPLPIITSTEIWVDRFDDPSGKNCLGTFWFSFTDASNKAKSVITPSVISDCFKTSTEKDRGRILEFSYRLDKADYQWEPYVGIGTNLVDSNISVNLDKIQGIAYDYKGSNHSFVYQLSSVKDYAHFKRMVPESEEWTTMIIPISELKQPSWGRQMPFIASFIQGLQWSVMGRTGDTGTLAIDNIRILRKLPEAKTDEKEKVTAKTKEVGTLPEIPPTTRVLSDKVVLADWYGFNKAAYSLSFDDGLLTHGKYLDPILAKYKLKATFYLVSETLERDSLVPNQWRFGYWYQFDKLFRDGHEIGSHSATHPKLTTFPDGKANAQGTLQYELYRPKKILESRYGKTITFAYPFVDYNQHVLDETGKYYYSSRGMGSGFNSKSPSDWMNLQSHGIMYSGTRTLASDSLKYVELEKWIENNTIAKGGWTILMTHDVMPLEEAKTATDSWQPVSTESFEQFSKWLQTKQNKQELWVETVGNVTRYCKERDAVSIQLIEESTTKLVFSVTDNLPDDIFNYPLTLQIKVPNDWRTVTASQKNQAKKRTTNNLLVKDGMITWEAIPDGGNLVLERSE